MDIHYNIDLDSREGREKAITTLSQAAREIQHALVGLEVISVAEQLVSGLVTTEEALHFVVQRAGKTAVLLVGDLDLLTGLRKLGPPDTA